MAIKVYKKNRSARKNSSVVSQVNLSKKKPLKGLVKAGKRVGGRAKSGKITVRRRGGGHKRLLRTVNFGRGFEKGAREGKVKSIEYDPNRSANIALIVYDSGERGYVIAWDGVKVGDRLVEAEKAEERSGNRMKLKNITPGTSVYNVEIKPGRGGKMLRAAGCMAVVMDVKEGKAILKMPSGEKRLVSSDCWATVGVVGNSDHRLVRVGSAGRKRRMGRRPAVRGKAMNSFDHPHGGGEGGSPVGLKHPKTKWGKRAFGVKTRKRGKYSDSQIVSRRVKKKR